MADKLKRSWFRLILSPVAIALLVLLSFWLGRLSTEEKQSAASDEEAHSEAEPASHEHGETGIPTHAENATGNPVEDGAHKHTEEKEETHNLKLSLEAQRSIGLKTAVADFRAMESVVHILGVVKEHPDKVAQVSSRVAGKIVGVFARIGDRVRKGQRLAEVESVEIQKLEVELIQAENSMRLALAERNRVKKLVESKIAAQKELIAAENRHQTVLNEIRGLSQQLLLLGLPKEVVRKVRAEKSISTFSILSPINGVVAERHVVLGETVEPEKPMFKVFDPTVVFIEGDAFEEALPRLRIGQKARVRVASYPGKIFTGRVSRISPTIDPQKRTVHLWVQVRNPAGKLKLNLFAEMDIVMGEGKDLLTIPVNSIITTESGTIVFVEDKKSFRRADVILGARDDLYVEVKRGISPGDRVVMDGKQQVYTQWLIARQGGAALGGHQH